MLVSKIKRIATFVKILAKQNQTSLYDRIIVVLKFLEFLIGRKRFLYRLVKCVRNCYFFFSRSKDFILILASVIQGSKSMRKF